jgi:hypothetical protein
MDDGKRKLIDEKRSLELIKQTRTANEQKNGQGKANEKSCVFISVLRPCRLLFLICCLSFSQDEWDGK